MPGRYLQASDISAADTALILRFLNGVRDAQDLANTVGFSEGGDIGQALANSLMVARPFRTLRDVETVTGINPARFTEIAMALSGARPFDARDRLTFLSPARTLWLGQSINLTAQITDPNGRGALSRAVTCITSTGVVSARSGLQIQSGSAIRILPEPGGLIRFAFHPDPLPPDNPRTAAALTAALSRLPETATTPITAQSALVQMADRYRGEGSGALRDAIDRLFDLFDVPGISPSAPWPVAPVSILALTHDDDGQILQASTMTLELRNWLGGFYAALKGQIGKDTVFTNALATLNDDAARGLDLSAQLIHATQGFAALEKGKLGRKLRDEVTGPMLNAFLETATQNLEGDAIVNTVRAAGASGAALANGGFAVLDAVRNVQAVDDVIRPNLGTVDGLKQGDLLPLENRLGLLETNTATNADLTRLEQTFGTRLDDQLGSFGLRLDGLEDTAVTQDTLDGLRADISQDLDQRFERFDQSDAINDRFGAVDSRIGGLERDMITQAGLDGFRVDLANDFSGQLSDQIGPVDARLATVEQDFVTGQTLGRVQTDIARDVAAQLEQQSATVTTRLDAIENAAVTSEEIDTLTSEFDQKLDALDLSAALNDRLASLESQLTEFRQVAATQADLAALSRDLDNKLPDASLLDSVNSQIETLTTRVSSIEDTQVTQDAFDRLRSDLSQDINKRFEEQTAATDFKEQFDTMNGRVGTLERNIVTRRDLTTQRTQITREFDGKLAEVQADSLSKDDLRAFDLRLNGLEDTTVRRTELDEFRVDMAKDFGERIDAIEGRDTRDPRIDTLRRDMNADMDRRFENTVQKDEMDARIESVQSDMARSLQGKANAQTVAGMRRSITQMQQSQTQLETSMGRLETQIVVQPTRPPFRPR